MPTGEGSSGISSRRRNADSQGAKPGRLVRGADFEHVYRDGRSCAHALLRMYVAPSETERVRVAHVAGRRVGAAVARNRAKRLMREASRELLGGLRGGHDIIFVAHRPLAAAGMAEARGAVAKLLRRAGLVGEGQ